MDYIGSKCPVCDKYFHADEDVVVCPECGTPHHRACYDALGHCCHQDRHASGYDYESEREQVNDQAVLCRSCGKPNDKNAFFCKYCAAPLSRDDEQNRQPNGDAGQPGGAGNMGGMGGMPFGAGSAMYMDPLGGVPADTDMGEGISAGETAKYVKQNTPYFIRVFYNLTTFNRSRFNFCAALFAGGYLLYRKMYKIGALLTALQLGLMILSTYITIRYQSEFQTLYSQVGAGGSFNQLFTAFATIGKGHVFVLYIPTITWLVTLVMRIVIGFTANRMYLNHCRRQITLIKLNSNGESPENALQTKGGVNMPLAISLLITNIIISYLPNILGYYL